MIIVIRTVLDQAHHIGKSVNTGTVESLVSAAQDQQRWRKQWHQGPCMAELTEHHCHSI